MIGTLDAAAIEEVLGRQRIGRLGISSADRVFIIPVAYGYDGVHVYIHSHVGRFGGHKVRLMRFRPTVCLEVEEIESPLKWRTVLVHGAYEELTSPAEREAALAAIVAQGGEPAPLSVAPYVGGPDEIVLFRIVIHEKSGRKAHDLVSAAPVPPVES